MLYISGRRLLTRALSPSGIDARRFLPVHFLSCRYFPCCRSRFPKGHGKRYKLSWSRFTGVSRDGLLFHKRQFFFITFFFFTRRDGRRRGQRESHPLLFLICVLLMKMPLLMLGERYQYRLPGSFLWTFFVHDRRVSEKGSTIWWSESVFPSSHSS